MLKTILLSCAFVVAATSLAATDESSHPDFSGSWELNEERSDDVREKLRQATRPSAAAVRQRGRPAPGAFGSDRQGSESDLEDMVETARIVNIRHQDPEMEISAALPGRQVHLMLYTDGRTFDRPSGPEETVEASAHWRGGGRLVFDYTIAGGRGVKETWELVAEGTRVLVATEIAAKSLSPAVSFQRVYDRVEIVQWAVPE